MKKYTCSYCGNKISEFDYKNFKLCGKCREIQELKSLIKHKKELERENKGIK
jgi:hypothetical protein